MNRWQLTDREAESMDAIVEFGSSIKAAKALGLSPRTVEIYLARAKKKMQTSHMVTAAIRCDREKMVMS